MNETPTAVEVSVDRGSSCSGGFRRSASASVSTLAPLPPLLIEPVLRISRTQFSDGLTREHTRGSARGPWPTAKPGGYLRPCTGRHPEVSRAHSRRTAEHPYSFALILRRFLECSLLFPMHSEAFTHCSRALSYLPDRVAHHSHELAGHSH